MYDRLRHTDILTETLDTSSPLIMCVQYCGWRVSTAGGGAQYREGGVQ